MFELKFSTEQDSWLEMQVLSQPFNEEALWPQEFPNTENEETYVRKVQGLFHLLISITL